MSCCPDLGRKLRCELWISLNVSVRVRLHDHMRRGFVVYLSVVSVKLQGAC